MDKTILMLMVLVMGSGCGMAPSKSACDAQYTAFEKKTAAYTTGTTTKAQIIADLGNPVTDYAIYDYAGNTYGSTLGYRLYENGTDATMSCGFYFLSVDSSGLLNTQTVSNKPDSTITVNAIDEHRQY